MARPLTYNARLVGRRDLTDELAVFHVAYDDDSGLDPPSFLPGQYVAIGLNNEGEPELGSVTRAMSVASAPEEPESFEFYIRWVARPESDNPLTHLLWSREEGDPIFMTRKPTGRFTLSSTVGEDSERLLLCVAAGTGLAPFVSMLRSLHLREPEADMSRFVVLHGASYPADLGYRDEMTEYVERHGLHYYPTISRPAEAPDWTGDAGRVEDFFLPGRIEELERRVGLPTGGLRPQRAALLICGLQGTIGTTMTRLIPRGFVPENRRLRQALAIDEEVAPSAWWEQYDNTPVIDLNDPDLIGALSGQLHEALTQ